MTRPCNTHNIATAIPCLEFISHFLSCVPCFGFALIASTGCVQTNCTKQCCARSCQNTYNCAAAFHATACLSLPTVYIHTLTQVERWGVLIVPWPVLPLRHKWTLAHFHSIPLLLDRNIRHTKVLLVSAVY